MIDPIRLQLFGPPFPAPWALSPSGPALPAIAALRSLFQIWKQDQSGKEGWHLKIFFLHLQLGLFWDWKTILELILSSKQNFFVPLSVWDFIMQICLKASNTQLTFKKFNCLNISCILCSKKFNYQIPNPTVIKPRSTSAIPDLYTDSFQGMTLQF